MNKVFSLITSTMEDTGGEDGWMEGQERGGVEAIKGFVFCIFFLILSSSCQEVNTY